MLTCDSVVSNYFWITLKVIDNVDKRVTFNLTELVEVLVFRISIIMFALTVTSVSQAAHDVLPCMYQVCLKYHMHVVVMETFVVIKWLILVKIKL